MVVLDHKGNILMYFNWVGTRKEGGSWEGGWMGVEVDSLLSTDEFVY